MIRAVIFDLDDTLYDEMQFVRCGFSAVSLYMAREKRIARKRFHQLLLKTMARYGRGHVFDIAAKELGIYDKDIVKKLIGIYRTNKARLSLYPETRKVLSALRRMNYKLGIITDGDVNVQNLKIEVLKIKELFDCLIFSDRYGSDKQKPDMLPYRKALKALGVRADESVYVGDDPHKDFITAKKMGMLTIRLIKGRFKRVALDQEREADHKIKNLNGISRILKSGQDHEKVHCR